MLMKTFRHALMAAGQYDGVATSSAVKYCQDLLQSRVLASASLEAAPGARWSSIA
jgi:hypothetical protein